MKVETKSRSSRSSHHEVYHIWAAKDFAEFHARSGPGALVRSGDGQTAIEPRATAGGDPGPSLGEVGVGYGTAAASPGPVLWTGRETADVPRPQHFADGAGANRVAQILRTDR